MKYERVDASPNTSEESSRSPRDERRQQPTSLLSFCTETVSIRLSSLKDSPRELYINFVLKFLESFSYFAVSQILVIYLHTEFGFSDMQAGSMYGLWGISITFWGLCASALNDILGVRKSLLIGFSISVFSTLSLALVNSRTSLFFILFGIYPIGTAMGIPMLTVGIRRSTFGRVIKMFVSLILVELFFCITRYTTSRNRGFAFGLYYSVMNIAAFVSGPVVDIYNIYFSQGVTLFG